jgi:xenotropic and polytropic retrovirus receptor 1
VRRPSSRASNPQTPNGNEADREDERSTPRSGTYGSVSKSKSPLRHRSPRRIQTTINTTQPAESTGLTPTTVSPQAVSTGSDDSSTPIVPPPPKPQGRKSTFAKFSDSQSHIRQAFDSFKRTGRKTTTDSLEEVGLTKDSDLEYNEAELNFLYWLDSEIEKIDEFYQEKENDAVERYKLLSAQLDALRQLRETIRLESNETSQSVSRAEPSDGAVHRASWVQKPIYKMRASLDGLSSAMPAADHERRAKQPELMAHPISTATGYVEYRVAKRRLKQAVLEFYRGMELLKGYRLLNRTGLSKILKKFDKTSGRKITAQYTEKLKSVHFDQSDSLENIMDQTEVGMS